VTSVACAGFAVLIVAVPSLLLLLRRLRASAEAERAESELAEEFATLEDEARKLEQSDDAVEPGPAKGPAWPPPKTYAGSP
jgi:hypothetical protein